MTDQLELPGGIRIGTTGWYWPRCGCGSMEMGPERRKEDVRPGVWTSGGGGQRHYSNHPESPKCGWYPNDSCATHSRLCDCEKMVMTYPGGRKVEVAR